MELRKNITTTDLISCLFTAVSQIHIFHLQVDDYAAHKTLDDLYKGIPDYIDGLVETIQGKTLSILKDYKLGTTENYKSIDQVIKYNKSIIEKLNNYRDNCTFEWDNIDNQIQTLIDLLESSNYKLKFLK